MKIIQMSDWHITIGSDIEEYKGKIDKLYESLSNDLNELEENIFCICGDLIDKGGEEGLDIEAKYDEAKKIILYIQDKFERYNPKFEFTPGNHDISLEKVGTDARKIEEYRELERSIKEIDSTAKKIGIKFNYILENNTIYKKKFEAFDKCINPYIRGEYKYEDDNVFIREYETVNLILVNSAHHKEEKYGAIDFRKLEEKLKGINKDKSSVLVVHHSLLSEYRYDISPIREAYRLGEIIKDNNIIALLHGHTHGYSNINIGNSCKVIGVGPIFKSVQDIDNQINVVSIEEGIIKRIDHYRYYKDHNMSWVKNKIYNEETVNGEGAEEKSNIFLGDSVSKIYQDIVEATKKQGCIRNLQANIKMSYDEFEAEVCRDFDKDIEKAKKWQQREVPNELYYNHGQYIKDGMDYVIRELERKKTSSRAIIPLINMDNIMEIGEDEFLPSFNIVQFGRNKPNLNKLYITVYLRALEVNHFFKINIGEIYLMIQKIKNQVDDINEVDINIIAFRAKYKEKFSCFVKADIDQLTPQKISLKVSRKRKGELIQLLENKKSLEETVVHAEGIRNLHKSIQEEREEDEQEGNKSIYTIEIEDSLKELVEKLEELKDLGKRTSEYDKIGEKQKEANKIFDKVIAEFNKLKI